MKKIINVRYPLLMAVCMITGILACVVFYRYRLSSWWMLAVAVPLLLLFLVFVIKHDRRRLIVLGFCVLFGLFAVIGTDLRFRAYRTDTITQGVTYRISGVCESKTPATDGDFLVLDRLSFNGQSTGGKLRVYASHTSGDYVPVGYRVTFYASVEKEDLFSYGKLNYRAIRNIRYSASVYSGMEATYRFAPFCAVNDRLWKLLSDNTDETTASLTYALLTGDESLMEDSVLSQFRYGGIAHIFAVSGLHIGILYAAVARLCKKCRMGHGATAVVAVGVCLVYAAVCGFTPSSVRAIVMCAVAAFARLTHNKYDGINSLSVAAILLLSIEPRYLFDLGFSLSFMAVGAVQLLELPIQKKLSFLPQKWASSIAVSLSAQLGVLPESLYSFGYVGWTGLFLNVIFIPLIGIFYPVLLASIVFCLIFSGTASVLIPLTTMPFGALMSFVTSARLDEAIVRPFAVGWFVVLCCLIVVILTHRIRYSRRLRAIVASVCGGIMSIALLLGCFSPIAGTMITVCSYYGSEAVFLTTAGRTLAIVTEQTTLKSLRSEMSRHLCRPPEGVIVLTDDEYCLCKAVDKTVCGAYFLSSALFPYEYQNVHTSYVSTCSVAGVQATFVDPRSVVVTCGGVKVGISLADETQDWEADLLITRHDWQGNTKNQVYFEVPHRQYNGYDFGDLQFVVKNDTIRSMTWLGSIPTW